MSRLIYVPVMHSSVEMGSAAGAYKAAFVARFGERKWQERCDEFDAIWGNIAAAIDALNLDPTTLKLYQDSLPLCGKEVQLIRDLAAQGSHNHRLLAALIDKGATLIGTESPELLLEEYRLLQSAERAPEQAAALLQERDTFIAKRIDATLGEGRDRSPFHGRASSGGPTAAATDFGRILGRANPVGPGRKADRSSRCPTNKPLAVRGRS